MPCMTSFTPEGDERQKNGAACLVRLEGPAVPFRVCSIIIRVVVAGFVQVVAPVCNECFVIQVVGVVGGKPARHTPLLVEQPLVIHRLSRSANICLHNATAT